MKVGGLIANRNLCVSHLWNGHYPIDLLLAGAFTTATAAICFIHLFCLWQSNAVADVAVKEFLVNLANCSCI